MRSIIKEIFNKTVGISNKDIEKFIIEPKLKESIDLEYKSTDYLKKGLIKEKEVKGKIEKIDKKEEVLIKPLVSFLNKFSAEGGLLILGVFDRDSIPEKIASAKKEVFTSEQFRSWIHSNISSVPPMKDYPYIDIKETTEENPVFLIEIHPLDVHTVYFSKITNNVYVRQNDTSVPLSFLEAYRLISNKICAKVFVKVNEKREIIPPFTKIQLGFLYFNEGFEPGEWVISLLSFKCVEGDPTKIIITPLRTWKRGIKNPGDLSVFYTNVWAKDIIYPETPMEIGDIEIKIGKDEKIYMGIMTHEKRGSSFQEFIINSKQIISIRKEFNTYI